MQELSYNWVTHTEQTYISVLICFLLGLIFSHFPIAIMCFYFLPHSFTFSRFCFHLFTTITDFGTSHVCSCTGEQGGGAATEVRRRIMQNFQTSNTFPPRWQVILGIKCFAIRYVDYNIFHQNQGTFCKRKTDFLSLAFTSLFLASFATVWSFASTCFHLLPLAFTWWKVVRGCLQSAIALTHRRRLYDKARPRPWHIYVLVWLILDLCFQRLGNLVRYPNPFTSALVSVEKNCQLQPRFL